MGGARSVLKANATILCQDCSAKAEEPEPENAHQPHEARLMLGPFAKRERGPQAAKLEARPLVTTTHLDAGLPTTGRTLVPAYPSIKRTPTSALN